MRRTNRKNEEGAIGIGTLIVFIALILVAAIAAAVIISTAEELEEQAEDAGENAQDLVEATPVIMIAEGELNAGNIETLYLYIDLYGSNGVDMNDVVLHLLVTPNGGTALSTDLKYNLADTTAATFEYYGTEEVIDRNSQYEPNDPTNPTYILGESARLKLTVDLAACLVGLPEASVLEIWIHTTTSGHQTYDLFRTPSSYPTGGIVALEG